MTAAVSFRHGQRRVPIGIKDLKETRKKVEYIDALEQQTIYYIREARIRYRSPALLWGGGKDATALLWMARKAFPGGIPFPVMMIDTDHFGDEVIRFREEVAGRTGITLLSARNTLALEKGAGPEGGKEECCRELKSEALAQAAAANGIDAFLLGIRGDEEGLPLDRVTVFPYGGQSTGEEPLRVHPLLHWTERDIWLYTDREKIPVAPLYFARKGKRYRNFCCEPCVTQVASRASTVKAIIKELDRQAAAGPGSGADSEDAYTIAKLKSLGYM